MLYDPRASRVRGSAAFKEFVESSSEWLAEKIAYPMGCIDGSTGPSGGELVARTCAGT